MTELLYLTDSYLSEFTATVEDATEDSVVLDRTAFYPTGGGQPHDTGSLTWEGGEVAVTKVKRRQGAVHHTLDGEVPQEGTEVTGVIDWDRRYALMRHHTAAHLTAAAVGELHGGLATGGQLYPDRARLDFELPDLDPTQEALDELQARVNAWVKEDIPLTWYEVPRKVFEGEDLSRLKANLLPDFIDPVRIVQIGGVEEPAQDVDIQSRPWLNAGVVDAQAGGGTHLHRTGEVGEFTITGTKSKGAENRRFYFEVR